VTAARVVLADDDVLLREGLASLLERSGYDVVGLCGNGTELLELVREHEPDLAIVDIRMPPGQSTEGLDAARAIREELPRTATLVLSAHVEVEHAMDLLASGERSGYLLKSRIIDVDGFVDTVERVVKGGSVVDPALVRGLLAGSSSRSASARPRQIPSDSTRRSRAAQRHPLAVDRDLDPGASGGGDRRRHEAKRTGPRTACRDRCSRK
jgi:DNA-binding NarL/FixJ family response regulator